MNNVYQELFKLSEKAYKNDCVPVGAIVVDENNRIIGKGFNKKEKTNNPLDHAEVVAIKQATKKVKQWNLNKYTLYVTMEPCAMCISIINECRITKVFYLLKNEKEKYKNDKSINSMDFTELKNDVMSRKYLELLQKFFKEKRKK